MENGKQNVGYGIPKCDCGMCIEELADNNGDIIISKSTILEWVKGICPEAKNPDPPPNPGPGFPIRMAA